MLRSVIVCVCLVALAHTAFAEPSTTRPGGPRLRAQDSRIARLIDEGRKRSPTMRALVERIEESDVIVYVASNPLMKAHLSGALSFVTTAGKFRYVRAMINADLLADMSIATLAHEFQHVVEVIEAPSVVDDSSLVKLYRQIGVATSPQKQTGWETMAAQATSARVRRELIASRTTPVADLAASVEAVESVDRTTLRRDEKL